MTLGSWFQFARMVVPDEHREASARLGIVGLFGYFGHIRGRFFCIQLGRQTSKETPHD